MAAKAVGAAVSVAVPVERLSLVDDLLAVEGGQEILPRGIAVGVGVCRCAEATTRHRGDVAEGIVGVGIRAKHRTVELVLVLNFGERM